MKTFEEILFPFKLRWEYALGNVAHDVANTPKLSTRASALYPGFSASVPHPRVGVLSLMLPVGCNAACPNICYTDIGYWHKTSEHLTQEQVLSLLEEFKGLGGKVLRIIGDGEPTLYTGLTDIARWCRGVGVELIVFSNGLTLPKSILREYEQGGIHFYLKLWSEDVTLQNRLVTPRIPYQYRHGNHGLAPTTFYELLERDATRVGFQVMFSSLNEEDAWRIIQGPKQNLPMLIEDFIPQGAGSGHAAFAPKLPSPATKACSQPQRASYLAVVNSHGQLQAGTFVPEGAVPVVGRLKEVWGRVYNSETLFMTARYPENAGCFCEKVRQSKQSLI